MIPIIFTHRLITKNVSVYDITLPPLVSLLIALSPDLPGMPSSVFSTTFHSPLFPSHTHPGYSKGDGLPLDKPVFLLLMASQLQILFPVAPLPVWAVASPPIKAFPVCFQGPSQMLPLHTKAFLAK